MAEAYKVQGLKNLQRNLRKYDKDMAKQLRVANKRAAEVIADEAKKNAPVGATGALQKSVKPGATQTSGFVKAGSASRVPYANPVHWGWQNRPQGGYNPSVPFIQRALKTEHDEMVDVYNQAMGDLKKGSNL